MHISHTTSVEFIHIVCDDKIFLNIILMCIISV